jgi:hypothetical protein
MDGAGVKRLARPDQWAIDLKLKVDSRRFSLEGREYIAQVIRDTNRKMVVKKAAQTCFTICFLVRTMHWIVERKWQHIYLLPLKTGAIPFVQKRIDPIIESSDFMKMKFKSVDNRTHKQTVDDVALLIRGTNVEADMQETPADVIVFDEYDRMTTTWLGDVRHRTDGSSIKILTYLSTPSEPGHGIDDEEEWHASDQHHWEVPCPGCGKHQFWNFKDNLKLGDDKYSCVLECAHCHRPFRDDERGAQNKHGIWVPHNLSGRFRGYTINQFNSPTQALENVMEDFFDGQDDAKMLKSFYNQALGEPYVAAGDQVTPAILDKCRIPGHTLGGIPNGSLFGGIDIGHQALHLKMCYKTRFNERAMWAWKIFIDKPGKDAFVQLEEYLDKIPNFMIVCDAHPEKRAAARLSVKYAGRFWLGFEKDRPDTEQVAVFNKVVHGEPCKVVIDRTMAFDTTISQYMLGKVLLPNDAREIGEHMPRRDYNGFYHQMIQQVRVKEENNAGVEVARWKRNRNADHWHHADMFEFIATLREPTLRIPGNMSRALSAAGSPVAS